jgi:hypothetical protein
MLFAETRLNTLKQGSVILLRMPGLKECNCFEGARLGQMLIGYLPRAMNSRHTPTDSVCRVHWKEFVGLGELRPRLVLRLPLAGR